MYNSLRMFSLMGRFLVLEKTYFFSLQTILPQFTSLNVLSLQTKLKESYFYLHPFICSIFKMQYF